MSFKCKPADGSEAEFSSAADGADRGTGGAGTCRPAVHHSKLLTSFALPTANGTDQGAGGAGTCQPAVQLNLLLFPVNRRWR